MRNDAPDTQKIVEDGFRLLGLRDDVTARALVPEIPAASETLTNQHPSHPPIKIVLSDSSR
jgi:hypothetical protein